MMRVPAFTNAIVMMGVRAGIFSHQQQYLCGTVRTALMYTKTHGAYRIDTQKDDGKGYVQYFFHFQPTKVEIF